MGAPANGAGDQSAAVSEANSQLRVPIVDPMVCWEVR
jgi:hypothetical protein